VAPLRAGLSLPSGRLSALVLWKLSHSKPLTAKLLWINPKPGSFLAGGGTALGQSRELLLPQGHPATMPRAAPSHQAWPHRCLPIPFPFSSSSSSQH